METRGKTYTGRSFLILKILEYKFMTHRSRTVKVFLMFRLILIYLPHFTTIYSNSHIYIGVFNMSFRRPSISSSKATLLQYYNIEATEDKS